MRLITAALLPLAALALLAAPVRAQQPNDIIITEMFVNPGGTITDANGEWFELYNNTNQAIDLQGWFLQDSSAAGLRPMHQISIPLVVPAYGFIVMGETTNTTNNGGVPVDYAYGSALSFANSLDALRILAPDGTTVIDRVRYSIPSISAQNGISRELKNVSLDNLNMDGSNWADASATTVYGPGGQGTPGVAGQTDGVLPVELVAFRAVADGGTAALTWETASETNNAGFSIEHRQQGDWRAVGFVAGHGTSAEAAHYRYAVEGLAAGTHRFRLRQVDFDGAFTYSAEVELTLAPRGLSLVLFGTPARDVLHGSLAVPGASAARIVLYDMLGRKAAATDAATGAFTLDVAALAPGTYLLRVEAGSASLVQQVVVVR